MKGAAPGYPAAAARPFNSSCKMGEKLTVPRPRDGRVEALSGTRSLSASRHVRSARPILCPSHRGSGLRQVRLDRYLPADLFDRLAPGLYAEEIIDRARHEEPAAEIDKGRWNLRQRHVRLEVIARTHDQR